MEAWQARQKVARRRLTELAWLTAALSRQKRLPELARLLDEPVDPKPAGRQSWQDMKAILSAMTDGVIPKAEPHE